MIQLINQTPSQLITFLTKNSPSGHYEHKMNKINIILSLFEVSSHFTKKSNDFLFKRISLGSLVLALVVTFFSLSMLSRGCKVWIDLTSKLNVTFIIEDGSSPLFV